MGHEREVRELDVRGRRFRLEEPRAVGQGGPVKLPAARQFSIECVSVISPTRAPDRRARDGTAPRRRPRTVATSPFLWGADTVGQGYGIDPAMGGLKIYNTMGAESPTSSSTWATPSMPTTTVEKEMRVTEPFSATSTTESKQSRPVGVQPSRRELSPLRCPDRAVECCDGPRGPESGTPARSSMIPATRSRTAWTCSRPGRAGASSNWIQTSRPPRKSTSSSSIGALSMYLLMQTCIAAPMDRSREPRIDAPRLCSAPLSSRPSRSR